MPAEFRPDITATPPGGDDLCFAFRGRDLLVQEADDRTGLPTRQALTQRGLEPIRTQPLGRIDGVPCVSTELRPDALPPDGMTFRGLRDLFGVLEETAYAVAGRAYQIMRWDQIHQFCGRCGTPAETVQDERAKTCPSCRLISYPRLSPAVIIAVSRDDDILLVHGHRHPKGRFTIVAGFVEAGETLEDAVHREIHEEVGIDVKNVCYFGSQPWPFPDSLMVGFTAEYAAGELVIGEDEIAEAGWFRWNDLPQIPSKISISRALIDWFVGNREAANQGA